MRERSVAAVCGPALLAAGDVLAGCAARDAGDPQQPEVSAAATTLGTTTAPPETAPTTTTAPKEAATTTLTTAPPTTTTHDDTRAVYEALFGDVTG